MTIASDQIPESMKTSLIEIHSYQDKNLQGILQNLHYGELLEFQNLTQLLLLMEDMMDYIHFPQATVQTRCFGDNLKVPEPLHRGEKSAVKAIATFKVQVLFRQGTTWQGRMSWIEGKQEMSFRSDLEMIKLMDNVLQQAMTDN